MANIIRLGSLYLNDCPAEIGLAYKPGKTISIGETAPGKEIHWVVVNDMLIADRCILTEVSWDDLNAQNLVFGKEVTISGFRFTARLIQVGAEEGAPNEWDSALDAVGEDTPSGIGKICFSGDRRPQRGQRLLVRTVGTLRPAPSIVLRRPAAVCPSVFALPWSLCPPTPCGLLRRPCGGFRRKSCGTTPASMKSCGFLRRKPCGCSGEARISSSAAWRSSLTMR